MTSHPVNSDVTAIVLNYGAPYQVLRDCIGSLASQTFPVEVLLIDNASPLNRNALRKVEVEFPKVKIVRHEKNYGFAGGMNRGVMLVDTEFVLLLNNDVILAPEAVAEMRRVIQMNQDVVGVAPKILFQFAPEIIAGVGNVIDAMGIVFDRGMGQPDIGQYDRIERVFGTCFAASLLRRHAFEPGLVGPLDDRFFMYYEDVDWCHRAGILGLEFQTAPHALVYHAHSLSSRKMNYAFKYRLLMRNRMRMILKNFSLRYAWKAFGLRFLILILKGVKGPYRLANLRAVLETTLSLPTYLAVRRKIQRRRKSPDEDLFVFSNGERPFFDDITRTPHRRPEVLEAMYRRLYLFTHDERHREIGEIARLVSGQSGQLDRALWERLAQLVETEPAQVKDFVNSLKQSELIEVAR